MTGGDMNLRTGQGSSVDKAGGRACVCADPVGGVADLAREEEGIAVFRDKLMPCVKGVDQGTKREK